MVVDGVAYRVIGDAPITNTTAANLTSIIWTATQTSFLFTAGTMTVNATFISPIEVRVLALLSLIVKSRIRLLWAPFVCSRQIWCASQCRSRTSRCLRAPTMGTSIQSGCTLTSQAVCCFLTLKNLGLNTLCRIHCRQHCCYRTMEFDR